MTQEKLKKFIYHGETENIEFKRSFGREIIETSVAFANTQGGIILLGITDSKKISGITTEKETLQNWLNQIKLQTYPSLFPDIQEISIDNKNVVIITIAEHPIKPISFKGRYYKRVSNSNHQMTITEIADTHLKTFNTSWDYYPDKEHNLAQISLEKVNRFIELVNKNNLQITDDPFTVLRKYELLKNETISNGCFLLFTANETLISDIEIGRFSDKTTIKDAITIRTDILQEVLLVMDFIKKHINKAYIITGEPQREERWDYPLEALREIVINMIVHRDYLYSSGSIIKIYDNYIEFFNPGKLSKNLSIEKLLSGNYISNIRNKQIASVFKEAGLIEKYGSGIQRILKAFNDYNLIQPKFEVKQHGFMVTVFKTPHKTPHMTPHMTPHKKSLSDRILDLLKDNPAATQQEISEALGIGFYTVREYFSKLKTAGKIERKGGRKDGYWLIK